jgi:spermidine synthase
MFNSRRPENLIPYIFTTIIISTLIIGLPSFYPWEIIPLFISFGIIGLLLLSLSISGLNLKSLLLPGLLFVLQLILYTRLPSLEFNEHQKNFEDKVIYSETTDKFEVVITQWMDNYWLYLNQLKNLSSIDEFLYYEPFAHTPSLIRKPGRVLVLGGENGCLIRELLKYENVERIDLVPYDPAMLSFCTSNPIMKKINKNSLSHAKVNWIDSSLLAFITQSRDLYDLVFIDLPDPRNLEINQYYTVEFYTYLHKMLPEEGIIITQAGSPYFATKAFLAIEKTIQESGFNTLPIHNQVITLGEWGWIIGMKNKDPSEIRPLLLRADFSFIDTRWVDREAMGLITSFGKNYIAVDRIEKNTIGNPVVYQYFLEGNWELE